MAGLVIKPHNEEGYRKVVEAWKDDNRTCCIHATGTGKSYIALQVIRDSTDWQKTLYLTSYEANLNGFRNKVNKYFPDKNVTFVLYAGLSGSSILDENYDIIILDEFHRCGAEIWGSSVDRILGFNKNAKVLGLSATPIRYLDNERDMSDELFDGNVASVLSLHDALIRGIIAVPKYFTCVYSFNDDIKAAEDYINGLVKVRKEKEQTARSLLEHAKKMLEKADGLPQFFKESIGEFKGKYLVFCRNYDHMKAMELECKEWFDGADINIYEMYSKNDDAIDVLEAFENDHSDTLRLCFCISMLNEGVHVHELDGAIMLRPTESLNVYFQQIGRVLSVGGSSHPKILDIVNNADSLIPVRNFWTGLQSDFSQTGDHDFTFEVFGRDTAILEYLDSFYSILMMKPWHKMYEIVSDYYNENHTINVPKNTVYREERIGLWLMDQRSDYRLGRLSEERAKLLEDLNIEWGRQQKTWEESYAILKSYYQEHGNYDSLSGDNEQCKYMLKWMSIQRRKKSKLTDDQIRLLDEIEFPWKRTLNLSWSDEEESILRTYFPSEGWHCAERLPGRSKKAVASRATVLGIEAKKPSARWTDEELDLLRSNIESDNKTLKKLFPTRSEQQIVKKARDLGRKQRIHHFNEEEVDILKKYYPIEGQQAFTRIPYISKSILSKKCQSLGLKAPHTPRYWTEDEIAILKEWYPIEGKNVCKRLNGRSEQQCGLKANSIGLKLKMNHD